MNKQKKEFIHIGFSSILMVFTMLCLVTFATLSLITANSDYRLSLKVAEKTTAYYEADTAARNYLQQLDLALADLYANCDDSQTFFEKAADLIRCDKVAAHIRFHAFFLISMHLSAYFVGQRTACDNKDIGCMLFCDIF